MNLPLIIAFLTYVVTGALPPIIGHYLIRVQFLGGIWVATLVGVIAAVMGGLAVTLFMPDLPDLVVIAGSVDAVPPVAASLIVTSLVALVSSSHQT
ncbi:MAG TPA: hypothetical protein VKA06_00250 [Spirochaetia bacterium]|nr:hypothetical protein [Spirochaetia bacterium]